MSQIIFTKIYTLKQGKNKNLPFHSVTPPNLQSVLRITNKVMELATVYCQVEMDLICKRCVIGCFLT